MNALPLVAQYAVLLTTAEDQASLDGILEAALDCDDLDDDQKFALDFYAQQREGLARSHDDWCPYRKRLELSFALGELSGALKGAR